VTHDPVQRRLRDSLYSEAMLLADEARSYFDEPGRADTIALDPLSRVRFSCESLKVTTRLMHVLAWLLTRRGVDAGEIAPTEALKPSRRLGEGPASEADDLSILPPRARELADASIDLHRRVARLDRDVAEPTDSPARAMLDRLAQAF
jgi:regulator of CtrA degradation